MWYFKTEELQIFIFIIFISNIIANKEKAWSEQNEDSFLKEYIHQRLKRSPYHHIKKTIELNSNIKKSKGQDDKLAETRTLPYQTEDKSLSDGKHREGDLDLTEYLRGDGYQTYPVPMSNPDAFNDMRNDRVHFGATYHFEGDPIRSQSEGGLTSQEVLQDAPMISAGHNDIQLDAGCSESCRLLAEDKIVDGERADAAGLIQEANMLKENSRMMAAQASHLEHEAMILGKPTVGGSVLGYSPHLSDAAVNADKPLHIPSGHDGQGPERGGTLDLEHNALHYGHHNNDDGTVQVNTGYPVYHVPTEVPHKAPTVEFVRPLPPLTGPNPYEVLTSSPLQGEKQLHHDMHLHHATHHGTDAHFHHLGAGHHIGGMHLEGGHHLGGMHLGGGHHGEGVHVLHGHNHHAGSEGLINTMHAVATGGHLTGHNTMKLIIELPKNLIHAKKRSFKNLRAIRKKLK